MHKIGILSLERGGWRHYFIQVHKTMKGIDKINSHSSLSQAVESKTRGDIGEKFKWGPEE